MPKCADCGHDKRDHFAGVDGFNHCISCKYNDHDCPNFIRKTIGS